MNHFGKFKRLVPLVSVLICAFFLATCTGGGGGGEDPGKGSDWDKMIWGKGKWD